MGPRFGDNASSRLDRRGDRGSSAASRARRAGSNSRAIVALAAAGGASAASVAVSRNAVARRALLAGAAVAIPALFDVGAALAKAKGKGGQGSPPTKAVAPTPVTNVDLAGRRLVAIGDVHGDFKQTMRALELGKVMDADGRWVGGTTVLVQVGDILDRGDNELAIMRKFANLAKQARKEGGDVLVVHGNHEIMNVLGDFRYATKGAYAECARYAEAKRQKLVEKLGEENAPPLPETPEDVNPETYRGVLARRDLFLPGGEMALRMAKNPTVLQVGDTVFAHAGIDMRVVEYGFQALNDDVAAWMAGVKKTPPNMVLEEKGVVWTREYGGADAGVTAEASACRRLGEALDAVGAKRLVVGHTPQQGGVSSGCGGRLWRSDVGVSRGIYGAKPQVIEIVNGRVRVLAA
jgi:hypothetical protein